MASESTPPPPSSGGGGLKYGIIGLLLLAGAVALWFVTRPEPKPAETEAPPPKVEAPERSTSLAHEDLVIPEPEPDAGPAEEPNEQPQRRRVRRSPVTCDGQIDVAKVKSVFRSNERQIRACYERRLKVNNILQGRLDVQVRIGRSGQVESVNMGGTLRDNEVYACVRKLAQGWKFPALDSGRCVVVGQPFTLTPQNP